MKKVSVILLVLVSASVLTYGFTQGFQGLNTGEFDEFLAALRAGALYVNVHSTTWPGGEIRSQIDHDHGNDQHGSR